MPIHVAITRKVLPGREAEFQSSLQEFFRESFNAGGVIGATMIVPPPGSSSREFGIIRTFESERERDAFYHSPLFAKWREKVKVFTEGEPEYRSLHGLEAWFRAPSGHPPKWKMAVATLIGVYPVSLFLSLVLQKRLGALSKPVSGLIMSVCVVALLTWVVMPVVTEILRGWLVKGGKTEATK